jgi:hypothetical protein
MRRSGMIGLLILFIVAVVGGVLLGKNQTVRAMFGQKFESFNYPSCSTVDCSVEFYIGSKIESYSPPVPPGQKPIAPHNYLVSPVFEGKNNMNMRIDIDKIAAADTASGEELLSVYGKCSGQGISEAFSEYLPNFGTTAYVCASYAKIGNSNDVIGYTSVFESEKTASFIILGINENIELNAKGGVTNQVFDMSKYENDIESIIQSLDVKSK